IVSSFRTNSIHQIDLDPILEAYHSNVLRWSRKDTGARRHTAVWLSEIVDAMYKGLIGVDIYTLLHNPSIHPLTPIHCMYMNLADFDTNISASVIKAC